MSLDKESNLLCKFSIERRLFLSKPDPDGIDRRRRDINGGDFRRQAMEH